MECHVKWFLWNILMKGWKALFPLIIPCRWFYYTITVSYCLVKNRFFFSVLCAAMVFESFWRHTSLTSIPEVKGWNTAISLSVKSPPHFLNYFKAIFMSFINCECSLPDYFLGNLCHICLLCAAGVFLHHLLHRKRICSDGCCFIIFY